MQWSIKKWKTKKTFVNKKYSGLQKKWKTKMTFVKKKNSVLPKKWKMMTFLKIQWSAKNKWETKTTFVNKNYSGVQQLHLQMLRFTHLIGLIFSTVFKINYLLHF